jgi:hypothetical protein
VGGAARMAARAAEGFRERPRQDAADGVTLLNAARSFHNDFRHRSGGTSSSLFHGSAFLHSAAPLLAEYYSHLLRALRRRECFLVCSVLTTNAPPTNNCPPARLNHKKSKQSKIHELSRGETFGTGRETVMSFAVKL